MYDNKKFAHDLREALRIRGINQKELAKASDITEGSVSNYLNGKIFPNEKAFKQINNVLGCNFSRNEYLTKDVSMQDIGYAFSNLVKKGDFDTLKRLIEIEEQIEALKDEKRKIIESA